MIPRQDGGDGVRERRFSRGRSSSSISAPLARRIPVKLHGSIASWRRARRHRIELPAKASNAAPVSRAVCVRDFVGVCGSGKRSGYVGLGHRLSAEIRRTCWRFLPLNGVEICFLAQFLLRQPAYPAIRAYMLSLLWPVKPFLYHWQGVLNSPCLLRGSSCRNASQGLVFVVPFGRCSR